MGSVWRGDAARLGIVVVLIGLLVAASSPAALAQATPEAEPTQEAPNPPAESTEVVPTLEPTDEVPTLVPTEDMPTSTETIPTPTPDPALASTPAPDPDTAPAGRASMGIMAAPFEVTVTGPATVAPGEDLAYTFTVTNTSGREFEMLELGDNLPIGLIWSLDVEQTTATCYLQPTEFPLIEPFVLGCSDYAVSNDGTVSVTVTAPVPEETICPTTYSIRFGAKGRYSSGPPLDSTPVVYTDTVTTEVVCNEPAAPFEVTVTGPATIRPGDDLMYTMTFTNTSGRIFERVDTRSDPLPSGLILELVPDQTTFTTCSIVFPTHVNCNGHNLKDGDTLTATVTATVPEDIPCDTTYTMPWGANAAYSLTPHPGEWTGVIYATPVTTEVVCDDPAEPFEVTVAGPATIRPGEYLTYTMTFTNTSGSTFERVDALSEPLPGGLAWSLGDDQEAFVSCALDGGLEEGFDEGVCLAYDVADGVAWTVSITAQVPTGTACGTTYSMPWRVNAAYTLTPHPGEWVGTTYATPAVTEVVCEAHIELAKSGSYVAPNADDPLGRIDWTLTVTNTGDVDLTNATVTDAGVSDLDCDPSTPGTQATIASLPPGADHAVTCTATSAITAADGGTTVTNDAAVSATSPLGDDPVTATASAGVAVPALTGGLAVTKTVTNQPAGGFDLGATVTYDITVTNTGDVPLFGVTVSDDRVTDLACGTGSTGGSVTLAQLDPGGANAVTCTASTTWPVPAAGPPDAVLANTVTVSAPFGDGTLTDAATAEATLAVIGSDLQLEVAPATVTAPGPVTLTWTLTNTGGVTLHGLGLETSLPLDCDPAMPATLSSGGAVTCTATLEATQNDIDAGDPLAVTRTLTVFGEADTATVQVPIEQRPEVTLAKSVDPIAIDAVGDVTWAFAITNTGNVTLTGLVLDDPLVAPATLDCDPDTAGLQPLPDRLAPETTLTCTAIMPIDQGQVDDRQPLTNTARVTSAQATSNDASATLTITPRDGLALVLTADPATLDAPGEIIWTYALANNGTSTLTGLAMDDAALDPATLDCDPADGVQPLPDRLGPGRAVTCTATETVGQDRIDAGDPITREAMATSVETDSNLARATVGIAQAPGIGLTKTVTSATSGLVTGDIVTYELVLTNTGNVTVADPEIVDAGTDTLDCGAPPEPLAPTATVTCTATYTITDEDMLRGSYTNTASATATVRTGGSAVQNLRQAPPLVVEATGSATVTTAPVQVGLTLDKTVDPSGPVPDGTVLTYTFVVTNTGNVTLDAVTVTDKLPGLVWDDAFPDGVVGDLAGGETVTLTATYEVTPGDAARGAVTNEAVATGQHPACREGDANAAVDACAVTSDAASVTVTTLAPEAPVKPTATPEAVTVLPSTGTGPAGGGVGIAAVLAAMALTVLGLALRVTPPRGRRRPVSPE